MIASIVQKINTRLNMWIVPNDNTFDMLEKSKYITFDNTTLF